MASQGLLEGVTVLDLGQIYNAPYATLLLALAGAKVIKIEPLEGERNRKWDTSNGAAFPFYMMNSNKLGVTLNLKKPKGRDLFLQMAGRADIVVENFRPGVMDKLGVGAEQLRAEHRELIYAASTGFGRTSRYGKLGAMDITVQAMSGAMAATGYENDPPVKVGAAIADFSGGVHLYGAIVTAFYRRMRTGEGAVLDVSMMDAVLPSLIPALSSAFVSQSQSDRYGNRDATGTHVPQNMYPSSSGLVVIVVTNDAEWRRLAEVIFAGIETPPGLDTRDERSSRRAEIDDAVSTWSSTRGQEEVIATLRKLRVACAPVRPLSDVVSDPYFRRRGLLVDVNVPGVARLPIFQSPLFFEDEPRVPLSLAPELGADNEEVYRNWVGLSEDEFGAMRHENVI